jgi:hypothetical protein
MHKNKPVPGRLPRKKSGAKNLRIDLRQGKPHVSLRSFLFGHPFVKKIDTWHVSFQGVVIDRRVFIGYFIIIAIYGLYLMNSLGWNFSNNFYLSCNENVTGGRCVNPCYQESGHCAPYAGMEYLPAGFVIGEAPPQKLFDGYLIICVAGLFFAVFLNTFVTGGIK